MAIKITLGNSKGGVGKTIVSNLLAYDLAERGYRVLLVDLDPQGNTTMIARMKYGFAEDVPVFVDGVKKKALNTVVVELQQNLYLVPGDASTVELERLVPAKNPVLFLQKYITEIEGDYDYIFFDVPPTAFTRYLNIALGASDYFVILTEATRQSFQGIGQFYNAAVAIQQFNTTLDCLGIVINRREKDIANFALLDKEFDISTDDLIFKTMVPARTRIGKYSEHGLYNFKKNALTNMDHWDTEVYQIIHELAAEILERLGGVALHETVKQ